MSRKNPAHGFCKGFVEALQNKGVTAGVVDGYDVWWIGEHKGTARPFFFSMGQYSPACFRVNTSGVHVAVPVKAWPGHRPYVGSVIEKVQLTFHETELTESIHDLIVQACSTEDAVIASPLFRGGEAQPYYDWSERAKAQNYQSEGERELARIQVR